MEEEDIKNLIIERLSRWATGGRAPPVVMNLHPTNRCNFRCIYCDGGFFLRDKINSKVLELSAKQWSSITKSAAKFGIRKWLINGGGDPLVRADAVLAILRSIRKTAPESFVEICTNGWFLTDKVAEKLVRYGCERIVLGIDAPDAKTNDLLKGKKGALKRTIKVIKHLAFLKRKLRKEKPIIHVSTVLNAKNYDKLPEIASLASSSGADNFITVPLRIDEGNGPFIEKFGLRLNKYQRKAIHKIWKRVERIGKQYGIGIEMAFPKVRGEISSRVKFEHKVRNSNDFFSAFCFAPFYSVLVDWLGYVGPCIANYLRTPETNLKTKSLKKIWYGKTFTTIRKAMIEGKPPKNFPCNHCDQRFKKEEIGPKLLEFLSKK